MPKHLIRRLIPDHQIIRNHRHMRVFSQWLHDPNLWHLNRRSVSGGFAVGLFMAFVPLPFQMVLAAGTAILFRVNLPLSVVLVWITNPLTIPPMFYSAYLIGNWILGLEPHYVEFQLSMECLERSLGQIWQPLLLGSLVCAGMASLTGFIGIRLFWRWSIVKRIKERRLRSQQRKTRVHQDDKPAT